MNRETEYKYTVNFIDGEGNFSEVVLDHRSPYSKDMGDWFSYTFGLVVTNILKH